MVATRDGIQSAQQLAFVLTKDNEHIDSARTSQLFGRAPGKAMWDGIPQNFFPAIGEEQGFFEYQGLTYMETFYDRKHGDIRGERKDTESMADTLAVFLRRHGETRQVCEIQMTQNLELP
jgi:hypothetical protein